MRWELEITACAQKEMHRLSDPILQRVNNKILRLERDPFPQVAVKLKNGTGYRIRVGDYRIIYTLDTKNKKITIFRIRHRSKAYR